MRGLAARQAPVQISTQHPREVYPTELTGNEEIDKNLDEWRRMNVLYECDGMDV